MYSKTIDSTLRHEKQKNIYDSEVESADGLSELTKVDTSADGLSKLMMVVRMKIKPPRNPTYWWGVGVGLWPELNSGYRMVCSNNDCPEVGAVGARGRRSGRSKFWRGVCCT